VGTLADTHFGSTTLNGACVFSGRALDSADHVDMLLPVFSLERWCDDVSSDPPSVSRLGFASVLSPTPIMQPTADEGK